uniref:Eco47II family restriction endonuclease n=1 Tax=Roseivirga sp. TaxID=1964215 RepID=UPI0040485704
MAYLSWISDELLITNLKHLLDKAKQANTKSTKDFGKNVIDPFSAFFQMSGFNMNHETWYSSETSRQAQKTLQNHVGEFHQNILGSVTGWTNMGTGSVIDLVNTEKKIIAELKNKYNTLSGGQLAPMYTSLEKLVAPKTSIYYGFVAYYVTIIPKRAMREDKVFIPSNREKGAKESSNPNIRQIDGASFYALVTGSETALSDLFSALPRVLENELKTVVSQEDVNVLNSYFKDAFGV